MKWVRVNKAHFNIDEMQAFYWGRGKLYIYWSGEQGFDDYEDPHRENYIRMCRALGVRPIEEDSHGKGGF